MCRAVGLAAAGALAGLLAGPMVAPPARAQWPYGAAVLQTVHNLSHTAQVDPMREYIANYGEACVYCHGPHGGQTRPPLWNRSLPSGPYRMYESATLDMPIDPQPTGISLLCLSCHDGTVGLDRILNPPNSAAAVSPRGETIKKCATDCHTGGDPDGGFNWEHVWFELDLRKQHPISILYDPSLDPSFNSVASLEVAGLRLYDGKVQCATCHEPHAQQYRPFLRASNAGGAICSVCHRGPTGRTTAHFW